MNIVTKFQVSIFKNDKLEGMGYIANFNKLASYATRNRVNIY